MNLEVVGLDEELLDDLVDIIITRRFFHSSVVFFVF
jgi:hypothetical protein